MKIGTDTRADNNEQSTPPIGLIIKNTDRNSLMKRYEFHNYLVNPLERTWSSSVKVLSICYLFVTRCISKVLDKNKDAGGNFGKWKAIQKRLIKEDALQPKLKRQLDNTFMLLVTKDRQDGKKTKRVRTPGKVSSHGLMSCVINMSRSIKFSKHKQNQKNSESNGKGKKRRQLLDMFRDGLEARNFKSIAILHYLKMASDEFRAFESKQTLRKHTYQADGLLFSKTRWTETSQIHSTCGEENRLLDYNIQASAPVMDRRSPISLSISLHFHHEVGNHRGVDHSYLLSLSAVYIFGGQKLMKQVVSECIRCRIKLKARFYQNMGPLSKQQLTFGSVNRYSMMDMSGPYMIQAGLNIRATRATAGTTKAWLLHSVCLVSSFTTITVLEDYSTDSFLQAIHRMGSITGYPEICYIDNSHTEIQGLSKATYLMMKGAGEVYEQTGIAIRLCGSGGESHARHGRIERSIALAKGFFQSKEVEIGYLTPIGFDSLAKQASTFLNSMPMATRKRHGCTMTAALVTPFTFLVGRGYGHRAPAGTPLVEENIGTIMASLERAQRGMLEYFLTNIPDLLLRTAWEVDPRQEIKIGDCVLFQKDIGLKAIKWHLGIIQHAEEDQDGVSRIYEIVYTNSSEIKLPESRNDKTVPRIRRRYTRKSCHTIVKLFDVEEEGLGQDIRQLNRWLKQGCASQGEETENVGTESEHEKDLGSRRQERHPLCTDMTRVRLRAQMSYLLSAGCSLSSPSRWKAGN